MIFDIKTSPSALLLFKYGSIKAKERIRELERSLESLQQKLAEQEDKSNKMYLHMYSKEQDAGPSTSQVGVAQALEAINWRRFARF